MLKSLIAIPLIIAFAAQTFSGAIIQLGYAVNPAAFAKYCVNKAKPKLHCNGKCQMMKKIREEEKKEQENVALKTIKAQSISSKSFYPSLISPEGILIATIIAVPHSIGFAIDNAFDFFHPPRV
ncbi:MAG: hypothetical protein WCG67_09130 [Ferruginibacter sp.]